MSTTVTSTAPKPVEASAKPAQAGARGQDRKAEGGDMFAALLGLLSATQVLPEAATTAAAPTLADNTSSDEDKADASENPLAALMGWGLPGAADATLGASKGSASAESNIGLPGAAWSAERAAAATRTEATATADGKLDISDMTPVEPTPLELASKGAAALPANAVRPGSAFVPTSRATEALPTSAMGTPWRHASLASTETLSIQQAANTSHVRSTVALNERFGATPGVPLAVNELRDATADAIGLPGSAAAGRNADTATALPGVNSGEGATASDNGGSEAGAFDQTDGQAGNPFAEANAAEEPTVTHWGTQHLRHASLRVGGEAGEQAIDIQLSMQGQEVQVAFKTDSAEARASLRENAGESLADLLGKSGIQLGGVSVGAQGQSGSRSDAGAARQPGLRGVAPTNQTTPSAAQRPASTAPRADGSQPLDVFA